MPSSWHLTARLAVILAAATAATGSLAQSPERSRPAEQRVFAGGELVESHTIHSAGEHRLVVQFTEEPLSVRAASGEAGLLGILPTIEAQHDRFRADLAAIASARGEGPTATIERTFARALNGVAVTVDAELLPLIRELDYVARIDENAPMRAFGSGGVSPTPAARIASAANLDGEGIVIAVIDTGVDYMHPALGGGLGPAFKVIGGFDFVNNSANPMDDNGHGTHVAGIAAGNGAGFGGVAPGARILAYKVLDAGGVGDMGTVISAIEAAIDPNGDGLFDDRAHVINLSLGGPGTGDDPASVAANNASQIGSVVVVAAGNEGGYFTIGSPASAALVVTVGAHDAANVIAPFSSRGPAAGSFGVKPDIVAPGVEVNSTWLNGGFATLSGTSMAAPYVAGAAALLLQQHSAWSPFVVKSALMSSAASIGGDVYTQGAGRVRAAQAATVGVATTSDLSFGIVDAAQSVWTGTRWLEVRNFSGAMQSIELTLDAALPPGVNVTLSPSSLTLLNHSQQTVTVTMTIDNGVVPYGGVTPPPITGNVLVWAQGNTIRVPFNAVKASYARVTWDDEPTRLSFIGQDHAYWGSGPPPPYGGIVLVPPGLYTVVATYARFEGSRLVPVLHAMEQVTIASNTPLDFRSSQIPHLIRLAGKTETGANAGVYMLDYVATLPGFGTTVGFSTNVLGDRFRTSTLTGATLDAVSFANVASRADYVSVHRRVGTVDSPLVFEAEPAAYRRVDLQYVVPPGIQKLVRAPGLSFDFGGDPMEMFTYVWENQTRFELQAPFRQTRYLSPLPPGSPYYGFSEYVIDAAQEFWGGVDEAMHASPLMAVVQGETVIYRGGLPVSAAYTTGQSPHEVAVGLAPPFWNADVRRGPSGQVSVNTDASDVFFLDASYGRPGGEVSYQVIQDGSVVGSGGGSNTWVHPLRHIGVPTGARLRMIHAGHRVLEHSGCAQAELTFDARPADRNPPRLMDLQLRSADQPTVDLPAGAANTLHLRLTDQSAIGPVAVELQRLASGTWVPMAAVEGAGPLVLSVPHDITPGYYGLRVVAADGPAGSAVNRLDYRADVAFAYRSRPLAQNSAPTQPQLISPADNTVIDPLTVGAVTFRWSLSTDADPGDQLTYALHLRGPGLDTTLTVWDNDEASIDLSGLLQEKMAYAWSVTASDGFAVSASAPASLLTPGAVSTDPDQPPLTFGLQPAYPNPVRTAATIAFSLEVPGRARLAVYDLLGRRVGLLVDDERPAGTQSVSFDVGTLPSGTYIYVLEAGGKRETMRLVVVR